MTKVLNLDKIETKRDKVVILNGKEHVMKTLTVKEYIESMKSAEKIDKLASKADISNASQILELTLDALNKFFPTIKRTELEQLSYEQLTAIRQLAEDIGNSELTEEDGDDVGEVAGE